MYDQDKVCVEVAGTELLYKVPEIVYEEMDDTLDYEEFRDLMLSQVDRIEQERLPSLRHIRNGIYAQFVTGGVELSELFSIMEDDVRRELEPDNQFRTGRYGKEFEKLAREKLAESCGEAFDRGKIRDNATVTKF